MCDSERTASVISKRVIISGTSLLAYSLRSVVMEGCHINVDEESLSSGSMAVERVMHQSGNPVTSGTARGRICVSCWWTLLLT